MIRKFVWSIVASTLLFVSPFARAEAPVQSPVESGLDSGVTAVLEAFASWAENAGGDARTCSALNDTLYGPYGGYFTMRGSVCYGSGSATVTYHDYAGMRGTTANGTMTLGVSIDNPYNPSSMTFSFDGGPIYYMVYGQPHQVSFHNVSLVFGISRYSVWLRSAAGAVSIDGQWVSMNDELVPYMFQ